MRIGFARVFWIGAAGIVVLAALVPLAAIVRASFSETDALILITLAALLYAGAWESPASRSPSDGRCRSSARLVAVASPFGLALLLRGIWWRRRGRQRASAPPLRLLAELDGVELVAIHSNDGLDARLRPGERLALRRRL